MPTVGCVICSYANSCCLCDCQVWSTKYGLTLTPDSLAWLETLVTHFDLDGQDEDSVKLFGETMEKMARSYTNDTEDYQQIVSTQALEDVYARLKATEGGGGDDEDADENGEDGGQGSGEKYIRVIDAFDMPALHFDGEKKAFVRKADYQKGGKQSIAGRPDSKAMYLRDRYNILKQLILRNEHFSPPALPGHDRENYMKVSTSAFVEEKVESGTKYLTASLANGDQEPSRSARRTLPALRASDPVSRWAFRARRPRRDGRPRYVRSFARERYVHRRLLRPTRRRVHFRERL